MSIPEVLILLAPGLCGSVAAIFYDEALTLRRALLLVFVGLSFSLFVVPAIIEYFKLTPKLEIATNFLVSRYSDLIMKTVTIALPGVLKGYIEKIPTLAKKDSSENKTDSNNGSQ